MKRVLGFAFIIMLVSAAFASASQPALAGGGAFNTLTFPDASAASCGTWQASGLRGQETPKWIAFYTVTDGRGNLLTVGWLTHIPASSTISARFWRRPVQNPIQFAAFVTLDGQAYNVGNLRADNPCIAPSQAPSAVPGASPTYLIPTHTALPGTGTPLAVGTLPAQPPYATIGCSSALVGGTFGAIKAPYIRATVSLLSNLNQTLTSQIMPLTNPHYAISLYYPPQPPGTGIVIAVGQWDGAKYVEPAMLISGDCTGPTPVASYTPLPGTGTPLPIGTLPAQPPYATIGCSSALVGGTVRVIKAPYIRVTVNLASNLNQMLASQILPLTDPQYNVPLSYAAQPIGTRLVIAVGQWDGTKFVEPAALVAGDCMAPTPVATYTPLPGTGTPLATGTLPGGQPPYATINCSQALVGGIFGTISAPDVQATVSLASNPNQLISRQIVPLTNPHYNIMLSYATQPPRTALVITIGQWDGTRYVEPTAQVTGECMTPTPTYVMPVPTLIPTLPAPTLPPTLPAPTLIPTVPGPIPQITLSVSPNHIKTGECVTITWAIIGMIPGDKVTLYRNIQLNGDLTAIGTFRDCPAELYIGTQPVDPVYVVGVVRNGEVIINSHQSVNVSP